MDVGARPLPLTARDVSAGASAAPTVGDLDRDLATLRAHANAWARLGIAGRIRHLRAMRERTIAVARRWVDLAAQAKGIAGTPLAGEEWLSGPWPLLTAIDGLTATLGAFARRGEVPLAESAIRTRRARADDGEAREQVIVDVFPVDAADRILLGGVRAEIWMQPGVTRENLRADTASFYRRTAPDGGVTLVLGAGNIASIPPLDVLTALYAHGRVAMLKLNPVNAYLLPVFADIFASLIAEGYLRVTAGGADAGAFLCGHADVGAIHLTGGERTHDAIVFGAGAEGAARKRAGTPALAVPVTSELGNVTPVIVVPGPWSRADLAFQAAHVATQKLHNAGANCIAAQVPITPRSWTLTDRFVEAVRDALAHAPGRPSYYPGSAAARQFAAGLDATNPREPLFRDEAFGPVLAQTSLPGEDAAAFLRNAVAFCNESLRGTLGASILIHPRTLRELGDAFEDALAALRYGCIAVNAWPGVGFSLATASWGAFPGNTPADVGSGIGVVHNAYLFDRPEKTVVRAPFAPFPRSLLSGERTLLPTPPWFVTHRNAATVGERLFAYTAKPSLTRLLSTALAAMRG